MYLLILDSLGSTELLLILGAALIFFGPRRLPQLSRQLGKSLSEFRRASEDFKRTWEREVNLETVEKGLGLEGENSIFDKATEKIRAAREAASREIGTFTESAAPAITPIDPALVQARETSSQPEFGVPASDGASHEVPAEDGSPDGRSGDVSAPSNQPGGKHDWL